MGLRLLLALVACIAVVALPLHAKTVRKLRSDDARIVQPWLTEAPVTKTSPTRYLSCSYVGDPHLLPFYQPYTQYWCQKAGWELLISNKYVTIYVLVQSYSNYRIHDYKLVFADSSCVMGGPSNPTPCSNSLLVTSSPTSPSNSNSYIHFHTGGEFVVKIDHNNGGMYDFYIWQTPKLVEESCGVCVRWDCRQEGLWMHPNPAVPKICDIFTEAAQTHAIGTIDPRILDVARISCINDIQTTLDLQAAHTAFTVVMQDGIKDLIGDGKSEQAVFEKVEEISNEALKEAEAKANELLANSERICNEEKKCLEPFGNKDIKKK